MLVTTWECFHVRKPVATLSRLVYYQSLSFNPYSEILVGMEWEGAIFHQILGEVNGVARADSVNLCFCLRNQLNQLELGRKAKVHCSSN